MPDTTAAVSVNATTETLNNVAESTGEEHSSNGFGNAPVTIPFIRLFPELAEDEQFLIPRTDKTLQYLSDLGAAMQEKKDGENFNSPIPAAYTYLGQFINHDTAFTDIKRPPGVSNSKLLADPKLTPWSDEMISQRVGNKRAKLLQLDSIYGLMENGEFPPRDPANPDKFALGKVSPLGDKPKGKDDDNDLVRAPLSTDPEKDRRAQIADWRNDSNLILSQLHVAFLRAHNAIVGKGHSYEEARQLLQKYYHWIILHDFLPKLVTEGTIQKALSDKPVEGLPFEFSMGTFRFGHSMVRRSYYINKNLPAMPFSLLPTMLVFSNDFKPAFGKGPANLPQRAIIEWQKFVNGKNAARALRTEMVEPLFELVNESGQKVDGEMRLAVQDLKRAYMMRIPTGQAIADQLGVSRLTEEDIKTNTTPEQFKTLQAAGFLNRTPLTFYILVEAKKANGKLGPVGSTIVAKILISFIRNAPDSIIGSGWTPDPDLILTGSTFSLPDLLRLAGVLEKP